MIRYFVFALLFCFPLSAETGDDEAQAEGECCERQHDCRCRPVPCYNPEQEEFHRRRTEASWPSQRDGMLHRMTQQN